MRVTAEAKESTRLTILEVTRQLLDDRGWENVSTRDIAQAAGIANGTLFNYFPTKEAIVGAMVREALTGSDAAFRGATSPSEQLFLLISGVIRCLRPYRSFLPFVIDAILAPPERTPRAHNTSEIRDSQLAEVQRITGMQLTTLQKHLYWTFFTGVVTFWIADDSRKQEQTLALIDQSVTLFLTSIERSTDERRSAAAPRGTSRGSRKQ